MIANDVITTAAATQTGKTFHTRSYDLHGPTLGLTFSDLTSNNTDTNGTIVFPSEPPTEQASEGAPIGRLNAKWISKYDTELTRDCVPRLLSKGFERLSKYFITVRNCNDTSILETAKKEYKTCLVSEDKSTHFHLLFTGKDPAFLLDFEPEGPDGPRPQYSCESDAFDSSRIDGEDDYGICSMM